MAIRFPNDDLVEKLMNKQTRWWSKHEKKKAAEREKKLKEGKSQ